MEEGEGAGGSHILSVGCSYGEAGLENCIPHRNDTLQRHPLTQHGKSSCLHLKAKTRF